jgi:hypothetical protein
MYSILNDLVIDNKSEQSIDNNNKKFAHYADKVEVTEGYVLGTPVLALCGKIFIPSRDPLRFPICPICKKIADSLFLPEQ